MPFNTDIPLEKTISAVTQEELAFLIWFLRFDYLPDLCLDFRSYRSRYLMEVVEKLFTTAFDQEHTWEYRRALRDYEKHEEERRFSKEGIKKNG